MGQIHNKTDKIFIPLLNNAGSSTPDDSVGCTRNSNAMQGGCFPRDWQEGISDAPQVSDPDAMSIHVSKEERQTLLDSTEDQESCISTN